MLVFKKYRQDSILKKIENDNNNHCDNEHLSVVSLIPNRYHDNA